MAIEDGGPAFPTQETETWEARDGMSLRDWFAGQALAVAAIAATHDVAVYRADAAARRAYELADAMLAAREEG